jgi:hypothetical protein
MDPSVRNFASAFLLKTLQTQNLIVLNFKMLCRGQVMGVDGLQPGQAPKRKLKHHVSPWSTPIFMRTE